MRTLFFLLASLLLASVGFLTWQMLRPGPRSVPAQGPEPAVLPTRLDPSAGPSAVQAAPRGETQEPATAAGAAPEQNRRAIALLEETRFAEAIVLFESCVELAPDEPVYVANLAEALARLAVHEHDAGGAESRVLAIEHLTRAVALAPSRAELAQLLERWRRQAEAEAEFASHETDHFVIRFDYQRAELSEEFYQRGELERLLEDTYLELGESFDHFPVEKGRAKIEVVIYGREAFDAVTGLGHWAGGVYDGTVRVPVETLATGEKARLGRVLRHELLHAFVADVGGSAVPGWLNEGLAQWVEQRGGSAAADARQRLADTELFGLEALQGSLASWSEREAIALAYAQSLALVDHLVQQYGERVPFRLVAEIGAGRSAVEAFREVTLGLSLDAALDDLRAAARAR